MEIAGWFMMTLTIGIALLFIIALGEWFAWTGEIGRRRSYRFDLIHREFADELEPIADEDLKAILMELNDRITDLED